MRYKGKVELSLVEIQEIAELVCIQGLTYGEIAEQTKMSTRRVGYLLTCYIKRYDIETYLRVKRANLYRPAIRFYNNLKKIKTKEELLAKYPRHRVREYMYKIGEYNITMYLTCKASLYNLNFK